MKILVTGAAGFIGSNFVEYILKNTDYDIVGIDNLQAGSKILDDVIHKLLIDYPKRFLFCQNDIKNINEIGFVGIDVVFHFAATPRVAYSVEHLLDSHNNNVTNSLTLLEWCKNNHVKKFVFSSSSSVYGNVDRFPTDETEFLNPESPYALQKKIIEEYCRMYSSLYGLDTVCLRYFNVYGENQYAENAYSTVICAWSKSYADKTSPRLDGDGLQSRDFTYVKDVCLANYIVGSSNDVFNGEAFNVGCGKNTSLLKIKEIFEKISGLKLPVINTPKRLGDVRKTHADIFKLKLMGYDTSISIESGVKRTFEWYKSKMQNNGKQD